MGDNFEKEIEEERAICGYMLNDCCRYLGRKSQKKVKNMPYQEYKVKGKRCWQFVPTEPTILLRHLQACKKYIYEEKIKKRGESISFLEAGSGVGFNLKIADDLGFHPIVGLEYNGKLIKESENLWCFHGADVNTIKTDIMDFKKYGDYDVIFYYMPIVDLNKEDGLTKFDNLVVEQMKKDAILISKDHYVDNPKLKRIFSFGCFYTYRKVK